MEQNEWQGGEQVVAERKITEESVLDYVGEQRSESFWTKAHFHLFNFSLAVTLIVLLAPLFLSLALLQKIYLKGPLFYKGVRLGRNKREFIMYKFRTLPLNAQQQLGSELLNDKHQMLTPYTRLMRDSRLDELPQLLNIALRDMDFIGPRPVRPEVYEKKCRQIKNYGLRFSVKPGLIGYAQLFTPHGAPKRLRAKLDNQFVVRNRNFGKELQVISFTVYVLTRNILQRCRLLLQTFIKIRLLGVYDEKRLFARIQISNAYATVETTDSADEKMHIVDINDCYFKVLTSSDLSTHADPLLICITCFRGGKLKRKRAYCNARIYKCLPVYGKPELKLFVIEYEAANDFSQYIIDQYFLRKSIA